MCVANVRALDLSQERCNVYMGTICLALPSDQSSTMDAPIDFARFRFTKAGTVVALAYLQHSPAAIAGAPSFREKSGAFQVSGYKSTSEGQERIDLVFAPDGTGGGALHVYADVSGPHKDDVAGLLAGLRICQQPRLGTLVCPLQSDLGPRLVKWMGG
jgi:hypothetical protein